MKNGWSYLLVPVVMLLTIVGCERPLTEVEEQEEDIAIYLYGLCSDTTVVQPDSACAAVDTTDECNCWFPFFDTLRTGLFYKIDTLGTGDYPVIGDSLLWTYTAYELSTGDWVAAGDSTALDLRSAIQGLQVAIPSLPFGTSGTLLMTSSWGYKDGSYNTLGSNQPMGIDFTLIQVCDSICP